MRDICYDLANAEGILLVTHDFIKTDHNVLSFQNINNKVLPSRSDEPSN